MDTLYRSYRMLLSNISTDFIRYLHEEIEWSSRLIGKGIFASFTKYH